MKKFFAILAIVALASCGGSTEAPAGGDTATVAPGGDTTAVGGDTTAVGGDTSAAK